MTIVNLYGMISCSVSIALHTLLCDVLIL